MRRRLSQNFRALSDAEIRLFSDKRPERTRPHRLFFSSRPLLAHATEAVCGARLDGIHLLSTYGVDANVG